jgi:hypothetical protein
MSITCHRALDLLWLSTLTLEIVLYMSNTLLNIVFSVFCVGVLYYELVCIQLWSLESSCSKSWPLEIAFPYASGHRTILFYILTLWDNFLCMHMVLYRTTTLIDCAWVFTLEVVVFIKSIVLCQHQHHTAHISDISLLRIPQWLTRLGKLSPAFIHSACTSLYRRTCIV